MLKPKIKTGMPAGFWAFCILSLLIAPQFGCKRKKAITKPVPAVPEQTVNQTPNLSQRANSELLYPKHNFTAFVGKAKMHYKDPETNLSATLNIHIAPDSLIWVSVTPALGIELVRCLFRPDSVFVLDRYNKEAYLYSYAKLSRMMRVNLSFPFFQALILGERPWGEGQPEKQYPDSGAKFLVQFRNPVEAITKLDTTHNRALFFTMQNLLSNEKFRLSNSQLQEANGHLFLAKKEVVIEWTAEGNVPQEANITLNFSKAIFPAALPAFNYSVPDSYKKIP